MPSAWNSLSSCDEATTIIGRAKDKEEEIRVTRKCKPLLISIVVGSNTVLLQGQVLVSNNDQVALAPFSNRKPD